MENKNKNGSSAQGAEQPLTLTMVKDFTKKDIACCMHLLEAIYRDQPTMDALADYLFGRYMNAKHKEDLERQTKLDISVSEMNG